MANAREIKDKIASIKSTQKITKAMEMVAASKMRKCQQHMKEIRPYSDEMRLLAERLSVAHHEYQHPFLEARPKVASIGYIVVSSDRGLCGGLNINLFREVLRDIAAHKREKIPCELFVIGKKALGFFKGKCRIVQSVTNLGNRPDLPSLIGLMTGVVGAYRQGKIDMVMLACNDFINNVSYKQVISQILPLQNLGAENLDKSANGNRESPVPSHSPATVQWTYIYEPEAKEILTEVLKRYMEVQLLHSVVENVACEMSARMVAMKSASDNAEDLVRELQLTHNKLRQASITQEISEIVGGAAAV